MQKKSIFLVILILSGLILSGCTSPPQDNEKITIVTTIFPFYEFAKEVGKDNVEVTLLLPPGAESHTFEPKPSDIIKISKADIFLYVGERMEPWAHDILEGINNEKIIIIEASLKVELLKSSEEHDHDDSDSHNDEEHEEDYLDENHSEIDDHEEDHQEDEHNHSRYDPHIWLDFSNDEKIVLAIAQTLIQIDSNNEEFYLNNANSYISKLKELDEDYSKGLSDCKHDEFITGGHNAFTYLAYKYNLESISVFGVSPDSEPTPQRIKEIVNLTKDHNIQYIYFEKLVNPKLAETIANEKGAKTLILNPAHNLLKEQFDQKVSFLSLMEENLENLTIGLECS